MSAAKKIVMVILEDKDPYALRDMTENVRFFCPSAEMVLYNSGAIQELGRDLGLIQFPNPKLLLYAKVTAFFFDVFEWLTKEKVRYDYFMNLETDMLFIRKGFEDFLSQRMMDVDYMGPGFRRNTSRTSRWRPIRSLRPELPHWYALLGFSYTNAAFSPGQVFSRNYVEQLLNHPGYPEIKRLLGENRSFTLQEVLLPTLVDFLNLNGNSYPPGLEPVNRYRPYQAISGVKRALAMPDAYFTHPIKREPNNAARSFIRSLMHNGSS